METCHVQTRHIIEYGTETFTLDCQALVNGLIYENCDGAWFGNEASYEGSYEVEIPVGAFEDLIDNLEEMSDEEFDEDFSSCYCEKWCRKYALQCFKTMYEERDPYSDTIFLSWF